MTHFLAAFAILSCAGLLAAAGPARAAQPPDGYTLSQFDLEQAATGRMHRVFIAAPAARNGPAPVIYLLDGNSNFPLMLQALAEWHGEKPVVIGIGYPGKDREEIIARRYFDLTPETPEERIPLRPGSRAPETGGRNLFLRFLVDTVLPDVEGRVEVDPARRTLFGHSLAGLFALHAMASGEAFATIVAGDPSMWWNSHGDMATLEAVAAGDGPKATERLLIITAGRKAARSGFSPGHKQRLAALRGGPDGADVAALLRTAPGLDVRFQRYPDETHGSMQPRALAETLAFALEEGPAAIQD